MKHVAARGFSDRWLWGAGALSVGVALLWVSLSPAPPHARPLNERERLEAYQSLAAAEPAGWERARDDFPADPWSQGDTFQAGERQRAVDFASPRSARLQDVLQALETGLREGWALPDGVLAPRPTVEPCRPRPFD